MVDQDFWKRQVMETLLREKTPVNYHYIKAKTNVPTTTFYRILPGLVELCLDVSGMKDLGGKDIALYKMKEDWREYIVLSRKKFNKDPLDLIYPRKI